MFSQEFIEVRTWRTGLVLQWSNKRQIATNYFVCFMKLKMLLKIHSTYVMCFVQNSNISKTLIKASGFHVKLYGLPKGKQVQSRNFLMQNRKLTDNNIKNVGHL